MEEGHTIRDHNATRYARDPIFFLGQDKHAMLEKAVNIGGGDSLRAHMDAGMVCEEFDVADMPGTFGSAVAAAIAIAEVESDPCGPPSPEGERKPRTCALPAARHLP